MRRGGWLGVQEIARNALVVEEGARCLRGHGRLVVNSITRITLPANALLNTRSFKLHFLASCDASNSTGGRLPADLSTLVERVEVSAGGVQLSQGTNFFNTLVNAKAAIQGSRCDSVTEESDLPRGRGQASRRPSEDQVRSPRRKIQLAP